MATKKKTFTSRSAAMDSARARDVVLERIESQMQFVVEAVNGLRETMDRRFTELEERLSARITTLEQVVRQNSEDIRKNSEDIERLRQEVRTLRRDFEHRAELARIGALEERVARAEAKLGIAS